MNHKARTKFSNSDWALEIYWKQTITGERGLNPNFHLMSDRLSQPANFSGFSHAIQALARASDAPQTSERGRSIVILALHILEFVDIATLTSLVKTSCEAGYLAIRYTEQEREAEPGVSHEMEVKLDELTRTLEEILLFCRSIRDTHLRSKRQKALPQWISHILIMWKIKKLRATTRTLSHKIEALMLETQDLAQALGLINDRQERVNTRQFPSASIVNRSSSQLPVKETPLQSITFEQTSGPTVHSANPSQGGSPDPPSQVSPPVGPGFPPSPTTGFFTGAHDFVIVVLPGASIPFTHVDGDQSIATSSRTTYRTDTPQ
ncbi:hypothetical protein V5O48_013053 [Marasmius crinis-equi]|uniref:Uncharacterized protein n=1 Tax=Marasmius crinis-equi TaxID=585013 RepID=A0ABR3F129_9AGAR